MNAAYVCFKLEMHAALSGSDGFVVPSPLSQALNPRAAAGCRVCWEFWGAACFLSSPCAKVASHKPGDGRDLVATAMVTTTVGCHDEADGMLNFASVAHRNLSNG